MLLLCLHIVVVGRERGWRHVRWHIQRSATIDERSLIVYAGDDAVDAETDDGILERYVDVPPVVCGLVGCADVSDCRREGAVCDEGRLRVDDLSHKVRLFDDLACDVYGECPPSVCVGCENRLVVGVLTAHVVVHLVCWRAGDVLDL